MKRFVSLILVAMMFFACAYAETASEGLEYRFDEYYDCYTVVGIGSCTDEVVVIPDEYEGKPVTTIWPEAFSGMENLKKIVLPEALESVGSYAFAKCKNLEYNDLNGCAYLGSATNPYLVLWKVLDKEIEEIVVPDETVIVYPGAFSNLPKLSSVTLKEGLKQLSDFSCCVSLKEIVIPESVGSIGGAFFGCEALENVTCLGMPYIDDRTFMDCTALKSITLTSQGFMKGSMIPISACESGFLGMDALTDIYFTGTKDEFIGKIAADILVSNPVAVHCTDGDIALTVAAAE